MIINYTIDKSSQPILINITIADQSKYDETVTEECFNKFTSLWESFYNEKKYFCLKFDTTLLFNAPIKYCYKMADFIKKMKQRETHYLKFIIITESERMMVRYLLKMIFFVESPVAPVYMVKSQEQGDQLCKYKLDNNIIMLNCYISLNNIKVINP